MELFLDVSCSGERVEMRQKYSNMHDDMTSVAVEREKGERKQLSSFSRRKMLNVEMSA